MKEHTTVRITEASVKKLRPCASDFRRAKKYLPLTLSTDPEENLDVAIALTQADINIQWWFDVNFAVHKVALRERSFPPFCMCPWCQPEGDAKGYPEGRVEQLYCNMQKLAYVADLIATSEGR